MIQVINSFSEFQNIEQLWDDLYQRSLVSNLFLTHTWLSLWIKHFGGDQTFALLYTPDVGRQDLLNGAGRGSQVNGACRGSQVNGAGRGLKDERCKLEAGVVLKRYDKAIGFIETDFSYYPDFLATPHSTAPIRDLLVHLKGLKGRKGLMKGNHLPSKLVFAGAHVNSALCKNIEILAQDQWVPIFKYPSKMRSIVLSGTFDSYLKSQGAKFKSEIRRKVHRAQSNYRVSLKTFSRGDEKGELFETVRSIEQDSWKTQEGSAIIDNEKQLHFYGDVFTRYAEQDKARAFVLYFDDRPVSFIMGILSDHTYYALKTSYRLLYREYSPGLVLFATVIESFFKGKAVYPAHAEHPSDGGGLGGGRPCGEVNRLEFLGSDARWKGEFSNYQEDFCTLELYPISPRSLSYYIIYQYVRPVVKKLFH
jgi:hypothetical protein